MVSLSNHEDRALPDRDLAKAPKQNIIKTKRPRQFVVGELPSREAILEAMADEPTLDGKRDLTRHFGIKGDMRTPFKVLLREMEGEGLLVRKRKAVRRTATLPAVAVLDIPSDANPDELHAYPASWNEDEGERPRVEIIQPRAAKVVPGPGDRILARIEAGGGTVPHYTGRAMKILDKPRRGQIGIVRMDEDGARLIPVDRKQKEMRIPLGDLLTAADGDLVEVEVKLSGRLMIPRAKVTNVIGNPASEGAVSLIAIHNLEIPYNFPASVIREAEEAREAVLRGREDWRDIDQALARQLATVVRAFGTEFPFFAANALIAHDLTIRHLRRRSDRPGAAFTMRARPERPVPFRERRSFPPQADGERHPRGKTARPRRSQAPPGGRRSRRDPTCPAAGQFEPDRRSRPSRSSSRAASEAFSAARTCSFGLRR